MNPANSGNSQPRQITISPNGTAPLNGHGTGNGHTPPEPKFDSPVILRQTPIWTQAIVWTIAGVTTFGVLWASFAKIEQAVQAQGKLEPQEAVKEVQVPVGGVVQEVYVEEGQRVEAGEDLASLDQTAATAQARSLREVRAALVTENQYYRSQMGGDNVPADFAVTDLPPGLISLTSNRAALTSEIELYRSLLGGSTEGLTAGQLDRLAASRSEVSSRVQAAQLEIDQLERQLNQVDIQLSNAREVLTTNETILARLETLYKEGGVAELQYVQQEQETSTSRSDVQRFTEERARVLQDIDQARQEKQNAISATDSDLYARIEANEQQIAQIDSQLAKVIVENEKQIEEIDSQLEQTELTLRYQVLESPVNGTVFDLQTSAPGYVANTSEPIMKIVPEDSLVARVFVTNQDIGFIKVGMPVDVRIDSFPYSEFGDIKGEVLRIGSDALPPDEIYPFYRFPVEISMDRQVINANGTDIVLQSGMSVSTNIRVRQRRVISIFTDLFVEKVDSLKSVR